MTTAQAAYDEEIKEKNILMRTEFEKLKKDYNALQDDYWRMVHGYENEIGLLKKKIEEMELVIADLNAENTSLDRENDRLMDEAVKFRGMS